jgi:hypothetical protein
MQRIIAVAGVKDVNQEQGADNSRYDLLWPFIAFCLKNGIKQFEKDEAQYNR